MRITLSSSIEVWNNHLTGRSTFCDDLFSQFVARPKLSENFISSFVKIERAASVLRCFSVAINVRAVNVSGLDTMDHQADTFLQQKENACPSSTFECMPRTFTFARSIQHLSNRSNKTVSSRDVNKKSAFNSTLPRHKLNTELLVHSPGLKRPTQHTNLCKISATRRYGKLIRRIFQAPSHSILTEEPGHQIDSHQYHDCKRSAIAAK